MRKFKTISKPVLGISAASCVVIICISAVVMHTGLFSGDENAGCGEPVPGSFAGIIVDGLSDEPIAGAEISAFPVEEEASLAGIRTVKSSPDGAFHLQLSDGDYKIRAGSSGYMNRGRSDTGRSVEISNGTHYVNAKLRLWPAAGLRGRIVAGDVGIAAQVALHYDKDASGAGNYDYQTLITDSDGAFAIPAAYAGMASVSASADGFASVELSDIVLRSGQMLDLGNIPLRDGVALYGQITDAVSGQGVNGAFINIFNAQGEHLRSERTNVDGSYRFPPIDMIQIVVDVKAEGYFPVRKRMQLKGNVNREISIRLKRAWGMTLDIKNDTGRDSEQTRIKITDVTTDRIVYEKILGNGRSEINTVKGGPFLIEAETMDKMTELTMRAAVGDTVHIRLKPFARIVGRALRADGTPLTDGQYRYIFRPDLDDSEESPVPWVDMTSSDFEFEELREGFYRVEVKKTDGEKVSGTSFFKLKNGDIKNLSVQLTEGGVLRGSLVSSVDGYNIANAKISVEGQSVSARSDADGNFILDKLPSEPFNLVIKLPHEQDETKITGIVVKENQTVDRKFSINAPRLEKMEKHRAMRDEYIKQKYGENADDGAARPDRRGNISPEEMEKYRAMRDEFIRKKYGENADNDAARPGLRADVPPEDMEKYRAMRDEFIKKKYGENTDNDAARHRRWGDASPEEMEKYRAMRDEFIRDKYGVSASERSEAVRNSGEKRTNSDRDSAGGSGMPPRTGYGIPPDRDAPEKRLQKRN